MCGERPTITKLIDYEQFCGIRGEESPVPPAADGQLETTVEELKRRLDAPNSPFILDVRNPEEFQICRIPGSVLIPNFADSCDIRESSGRVYTWRREGKVT